MNLRPIRAGVRNAGHGDLPQDREEYFTVAVGSFTRWAEGRDVSSRDGVAVVSRGQDMVSEN